jgi:hypothetical protein
MRRVGRNVTIPVRDSAGVEIVVSGGPAWPKQQGCVIVPRRALQRAGDRCGNGGRIVLV